MFARLRSMPLRRVVTRTLLAAGAVAGLCALADQGARKLAAPGPERPGPERAGPERTAARPAAAVADPAVTGSIRRAPVAASPAPSTASDALDRRGLAALMSSGPANAVAPTPAPKRKAEPAAPPRPR